ncbi:uncharacterized protein LOC133380811 [Rhineura floridana]|uniref:uncharacterized protein LOC133380811 n=1 Tax=Rhineura floridana TaxID=261503 RepID=UPI002AC81E51|nr:uncharacterized protein LOC133380811 [Rhineura floridana]
MDTTDEATRNQLITGQMNKKAPSELTPLSNPEGISNDDEDFLSGLSPEEKECLEYLLQTINTLDGDALDDDEGSHEEMVESLGAENQCKNNDDSRTQQNTSVEAAPTKPGPCSAFSKIKMIKSLSEESGDIALKGRPDPHCPKAKGPHRLADSHPTHFRKYDTIMRSGVNVQELRSRFLLQLDSSATIREATEDVARTNKQPLPLPRGQQSPRDEALQKLGLLQRTSSSPNMNSPLVPIADQHTQISLAEKLNNEATASSINTTEEPL